ncbi:hypothetical protein [Hydrogenophaga sp.]|uniref:hypothetical protein n=1 Tax=Hydrogenophaga sp. TaxID=1904254 RepID=UPI003F6EEE18
MSNWNRQITQKRLKAARRGHPGDFEGHIARALPEGAGLQAVGANIWCAVLAEFRQDRTGR